MDGAHRITALQELLAAKRRTPRIDPKKMPALLYHHKMGASDMKKIATGKIVY